MRNHCNDFLHLGAPNRRVVLKAGLVAAGIPWGLAGCGGAAALAVPFFTFGFEGVVIDGGGNPVVVQANFTPGAGQQGMSTGTLTVGFNVRDAAGNAQQSRTGTGTFAGNSMSLSLPGATAPLATAYDGEFIEGDVVTLTPTTAGLPTVTVVRVDNSFRPDMDASTWNGKDAATAQAWKVTFATPQSSFDGTQFLTGTDSLGAAFSGYVTMRRINVTLKRGGKDIPLSGRIAPVAQTPPPDLNQPLPKAMTITFSDGSTLARTP